MCYLCTRFVPGDVVGKRDENMIRIKEYKPRFHHLTSDAIHQRLNQGSLIKEAQIALRQILEAREATWDGLNAALTQEHIYSQGEVHLGSEESSGKSQEASGRFSRS